MSSRERLARILDDAARTLDNGRPLLAIDLMAIRDELLETLDSDPCLHYDYPPRRKMDGSALVCGRCSIIFGQWR